MAIDTYPMQRHQNSLVHQVLTVQQIAEVTMQTMTNRVPHIPSLP
jgi:hypothetical protein